MVKMMLLITLSFTIAAAGCNEFGRVDQGRVIAYDKSQRTIIMICDKSPDSKKPDYTALPPVSFKLPDDTDETGPEPDAGNLMNIDPETKKADIFIEQSNNIATINLTVIEEKKVDPKDPLVYDTANQKTKEFPIIDQMNRTITLYLGNKKMLLTFSVPDEYFNLPPDAWVMGDVVRIYYKEPGKSLRFMNVTQTDIFKK